MRPTLFEEGVGAATCYSLMSDVKQHFGLLCDHPISVIV